MNINANNGDFVIVTESSLAKAAGYDHQKITDNLELNRPYMVDKTVIYDKMTDVYLIGFSGHSFNAECFEDHKPQPRTKSYPWAFMCLVWPHAWRSDSNHRRHCDRCGVKQRRAIWDWNTWLNDNSKW